MDTLNKEFLLFLKCAMQTGLRYLLIGGYAVNYYGYSRNTVDLDVWVAPTNENRDLFIQTLLCMNYSESEVEPLRDEDFTVHFVGTIGSGDAVMDVLTFVHHNLSFDEAEKDVNLFEPEPGVIMRFVPYPFLKQMKLLSRRDKDIWDVARLEEIRNNKKN